MYVVMTTGMCIIYYYNVSFLATNVLVVPNQFAVSSVGDNATLTCTPGDTSLSIDWYRGNQLLTASSKYIFSPIIRYHMLTITNVQLNDTNSYYCTFADSEIIDDLKIELIVVEGIHMYTYSIQIIVNS